VSWVNLEGDNLCHWVGKMGCHLHNLYSHQTSHNIEHVYSLYNPVLHMTLESLTLLGRPTKTSMNLFLYSTTTQGQL
jgi:hypothetical protein